MKETKRLAFNFLRSYFDVLNNLQTDKDKLDFLMAVINKQFLNEDPQKLDFIPNLCYESQRHSIEKSIKGWIRANNDNPPCDPPCDVPYSIGSDPEEGQVQGEEEGKVQGKGKEQDVALKLLGGLGLNEFEEFDEILELFREFIKVKKQKKASVSEKQLSKQLKKLSELGGGNIQKMIKILEKSVNSGWADLYQLKNEGTNQDMKDGIIERTQATIDLILKDENYK